MGESKTGPPPALKGPCPGQFRGQHREVKWAPEKAVTPLGQLPFFVDFPKRANLFKPFAERAPLSYSSPNAPQVRDALDTLLMDVPVGARRYGNVNALRHDSVNSDLRGIRRMCSEDSVRRWAVWGKTRRSGRPWCAGTRATDRSG